MKIDTSSYYPKSPLGDFDNDPDDESRGGSHTTDTSESLFPNRLEEHPGEPETAEDNEIKTPGGGEGIVEEAPESEEEHDVSIFCNVVSWVLLPLLMPVYGLILAFNLSILSFAPTSSKVVFTAITAGINFVLPVLVFLLLKRLGLIGDIGLNQRRERLVPYIVTILCMGATGVFMFTRHAPSWLVMFFAGGAVAAFVNLMINFRWKISAHAAAIAGVVAMLVRIMHNDVPQPGMLTWLITFIVLSGVLGSARVWLGRHTPFQVLAGYAVGFLSVFLLTMINI